MVNWKKLRICNLLQFRSNSAVALLNKTTIGEISENYGEFTVQWKIKDFPSLSPEVDEFHESPTFSAFGITWCLRMYANGQTNGITEDEFTINTKGSMDLFLCRVSAGRQISLDYSIGLLRKNGDVIPENHFHYTFRVQRNVGCYRFYDKTERLVKDEMLKMVYLPNDVLTIVCGMKYANFTAIPNPDTLSQDFESLLLSGDHSDIIVKVKEKEFQLHKSILAARSSYFDMMFKNDMKEKSSGIVIIEDCEPDVFFSFIKYIYSGKVDGLTSENVCDLYSVADQYLEKHVKEKCLYFMLNSMSPDNLCDYLLLAVVYKEKELVEKAMDFFKTKRKEIAHSKKWSTFNKDYPVLVDAFIKDADE